MHGHTHTHARTHAAQHRERERKREEEVSFVRKMETCNIRDSVYVEGEETTCLMRELEKHGREGKDLVG